MPINTVGLSLHAVETLVIQTLSRGRKASVDEGALVRLLGASLADPSVTDWANQVAARYQITWSRRPPVSSGGGGGILFALLPRPAPPDTSANSSANSSADSSADSSG